MRTQRVTFLVVASTFLLLPAAAWAQSGITGVVRDSSGAVLPGVTVEAASPALIEKVRSVTTDGQGVYTIVDVRPGTYTVTFTLAGFRTFVREGVVLPSQFVATVNAEMAVGALEESITVSGEAPVVDIRTTRSQVQLSNETMEALPGTGRLASISNFLPGATLNRPEDRSVGGLNDRSQTTFRVHGAPLAQPVVDGMNLELPALSQAVMVYNTIAMQEVVVETAGAGADRDSGGMQINMIAKDGGNVFSGSVQAAFTGPDLEWNNINDELEARNLSTDRLGSLKKYRDTAAAFGGPIQRDTLWFFGAYREGVAQLYAEGRYYNKLLQPLVPGTAPTTGYSYLFEPDLDQPAFTDEFSRDFTLRLTWQAAEKHKFVFASSFQPNCNCIYNLLQASPPLEPRATGEHRYNPNFVPQVSWTYPASNRLLIEAGLTVNRTNQNDTAITDLPYGLPEVPRDDIRITDQGITYTSPATGPLVYGSVPGRVLPRYQHQERLAVSYVTGSHNFKSGFTYRNTRQGDIDKLGYDLYMSGTAVQYRYSNGVPNQVTILDSPWNLEETTTDLAIYAQDQWTIQRLTLNGGLRYNEARASTPVQVLGAGFFVPERRFEPTSGPEDGVPRWRNLSPRVGAAYDIFGTGRTALKFSLGHYPDRLIAVNENPIRNLTRSVARTWTDSNTNYVPDCDLLNPNAQDNRPTGGDVCAGWANSNFGLPETDTTRANDALEGFNKQFSNWQLGVSGQHELSPGFGVTVGYFRTWYNNFLATDNILRSPADYDSYCITAPVDPALEDYSGQRICGFWNVKQDKFSDVQDLVTQAANFGSQTQIYNGVDVTVAARFLQGGQVQGGMSMGRTTTNNCYSNNDPSVVPQGTVATDPLNDDFCKNTPPWGASTQVKAMVVYPMPYGIQTSVIYQNVPGIQILATQVLTSAQIAQELGRPLSGGARNANHSLVPANTLFEPRSQQLDLRFSKVFALGGTRRFRGNFDIYNLFNASDVLRMNTAYGSSGTASGWKNVQQILSGRLIKFGVQFDF